jgi:hypothetical protein
MEAAVDQEDPEAWRDQSSTRACARRRPGRWSANPRRDELGATRSAHVFAIDISRCPRCGGQLRVLAEINDPKVIAAISNPRASLRPRFRDAAAARTPMPVSRRAGQ